MVAAKAVKSVIKKKKKQASDTDLGKDFPKGQPLLDYLHFYHASALHSVFSALWFSVQLSGGGRAMSALLIYIDNHCLGRYYKGLIENFLASRVFGCCFSHYTASQQDPSHGSWGEYEPCSEEPYLGSEYYDPETPRSDSSDWPLILWPEVVKHLEGTLGLGFLSSQRELYSCRFAFTKLVTPSSRVRT